MAISPEDLAELERFRQRGNRATPTVTPSAKTDSAMTSEERLFGIRDNTPTKPTITFTPPAAGATNNANTWMTDAEQRLFFPDVFAFSGADNPKPGATPAAKPAATPTGTITQADLDKAIQSGIDKALTANNLAWQTKMDALTAKANQASRDNTTTALQDFTASLNAAGLGTLAIAVNNMILEDKTPSQIRIDIVKEPAYKARFPGMEALSKAGKAVSEATYISMERGMVSVLKAYGLDDKVLGTTEKLGDVIANQVSVTEYENRVQLAADHVKKNPDVLAALNEYYGVDISGAMATFLDPKVGMDIVRKQVRAAEIGAAAEMYQFDLTKAQAESYINVSGTTDLNSLKQSFGKARTLATTQTRLTGIEGGKYDELESVATILGQDQERLLESQRRALREQARFAGQSGVTSASLRKESTI